VSPMRFIVLSAVLLGCRPTPTPASPLAHAWNGQASEVAGATQVALSDSVALATTPVALPPEAVTELRSISPTVGLEDSVRALFRAPFGQGDTGYVLCLPAPEGPYLVLTMHRSAEGRWEPPITLAQSYSDAGYTFEARSWLLDLNGDGYFEIVSRWHSSEVDPDHETQPPVVRDSLSVLRVTNGLIRITPAPAGDSLWQRFPL